MLSPTPKYVLHVNFKGHKQCLKLTYKYYHLHFMYTRYPISSPSKYLPNHKKLSGDNSTFAGSSFPSSKRCGGNIWCNNEITPVFKELSFPGKYQLTLISKTHVMNFGEILFLKKKNLTFFSQVLNHLGYIENIW